MSEHEDWVNARNECMRDVEEERRRQWKKWGNQFHDLPTFVTILSEEVGELSQEVLRSKFGKAPPKESENVALYEEATQVAAVALAIMQRIKTGSA